MTMTAQQKTLNTRADASPRYIFDLTAIVHAKGERAGGVLVNLSSDGLRIACSAHYEIGQTIWVAVKGWPKLACTVVWQDAGLIGCAMHDPIDMTTLANRLLRSKGIDRLNDETYI